MYLRYVDDAIRKYGLTFVTWKGSVIISLDGTVLRLDDKCLYRTVSLGCNQQTCISMPRMHMPLA